MSPARAFDEWWNERLIQNSTLLIFPALMPASESNTTDMAINWTKIN